MNAVPPVRIVVALIRDAAGRVLLVRKHGSAHFIQPGGKPEPGEMPLHTLRRELAEELALLEIDQAKLCDAAYDANSRKQMASRSYQRRSNKKS